jgi:hypothetical protein
MPYDDTEFVDRDFPPSHSPAASGRASSSGSGRAPSREDLDAQVTATQQQLAKLREAQEQLERAKSELEEMRRRRAEFQTGRAELQDVLTRGIGLLEKSEFDARRDAEQMGRSLDGLRTALNQVEGLHEEAWTDATWGQELSRALTVIENARMELNSARLKWPIIDSNPPAPSNPSAHSATALIDLPLSRLLRLGLALTWPLLVVGAAAVTVLAIALLRR